MRIVSVLTIGLLVAAPAAAQSDSVTVNGDGGGRTVIDPATGQSRYVPELLQPWQNETIRLRPPGKHRAKKPATTTAAAAVPPAETAAVTPPPKPKKQHSAALPPPVEAPKPAAKAAPAPMSGFGDIDLITGNGQTAPAAPKTAAAAPKPAAAPAKPARTASISPLKTRVAAGTRKDSVLFAAGASDPSGAAVSSVKSLASSLSGAMGENGRVQLMAYAGMKGEKTSDTRRLSLKRALVVRQLLIDDGIPSERIDVFALGGVDDDGATDRVDVFVKG